QPGSAVPPHQGGAPPLKELDYFRDDLTATEFRLCLEMYRPVVEMYRTDFGAFSTTRQLAQICKAPRRLNHIVRFTDERDALSLFSVLMVAIWSQPDDRCKKCGQHHNNLEIEHPLGKGAKPYLSIFYKISEGPYRHREKPTFGPPPAWSLRSVAQMRQR